MQEREADGEVPTGEGTLPWGAKPGWGPLGFTGWDPSSRETILLGVSVVLHAISWSGKALQRAESCPAPAAPSQGTAKAARGNRLGKSSSSEAISIIPFRSSLGMAPLRSRGIFLFLIPSHFYLLRGRSILQQRAEMDRGGGSSHLHPNPTCMAIASVPLRAFRWSLSSFCPSLNEAKANPPQRNGKPGGGELLELLNPYLCLQERLNQVQAL